MSLELGAARVASEMHSSDSNRNTEDTPGQLSAVWTALGPEAQEEVDHPKQSNNGEDNDCADVHRFTRLKRPGLTIRQR